MTKETAIKDLKTLEEYFIEQSGGSAPECLGYAIEVLENIEIQEDTNENKLLKHRYGDYVTYKVEWLLNHLAQEIYLLEGFRKWKEGRSGNVEY